MKKTQKQNKNRKQEENKQKTCQILNEKEQTKKQQK